MNSFPPSLCKPFSNYRARIFNRGVAIDYNDSKHLCLEDFKVYMIVALSIYILNCGVTSVFIHDIHVY